MFDHMAQVLVVEDDATIRSSIIRGLTDRGHAVFSAPTAMAGLEQAVSARPDVVILDLGLPDLDGTAMLRMLRGVSDVPVIVATARDDEAEIVAVLKHRFPGLRAPRREDICYATTNRQAAVKELLAEVDLLLVIGSENSSNSNRLASRSRSGAVMSFAMVAVYAGWTSPRVGVARKTRALGSGARRIFSRASMRRTGRPLSFMSRVYSRAP